VWWIYKRAKKQTESRCLVTVTTMAALVRGVLASADMNGSVSGCHSVMLVRV